MPTERKAVFILSLDCEGKWGVADQISDHHTRYFTSANLRRAYADLLALFHDWQVSATFAFVMAFPLAKEELPSYADLFEAVACRDWLRHFQEMPRRRDSTVGSSSGCSQSQQSWISHTVGVER